MNIKTYYSISLIALIGIVAITFSSCKDKKEATQLVETYGEEEEISVTLPDDKDVVEVPFTKDNDNLYIKATINNSVQVDMIFDTGASITMIGVEEVNYLYSKGFITEEDKLGDGSMIDASGGNTDAVYIRLKQIQIGDLSATDVVAMVVNRPGLKLLLGQSVLQLLPSYTIDNEKNVIKFNLKSSE